MGVGVESLLTSSILVFFSIASFLLLCKRRSSQNPRVDSAGKSTTKGNEGEDRVGEVLPHTTQDKRKKSVRTRPYRLKRRLLVSIFLVIVAAIADATVRALQLGGLAKEADDSILADLLFAFSWTVLFLSLAGAQHPTSVHQGTCILSFLLSVLHLAEGLFRRFPQSLTEGGRSLENTVIVLDGLRVFLVGLACILVCLSAWLRPVLAVNTDLETEPLLAGAREQVDEEDDDDDDDYDESSREEKKARNEVRKRPCLEYLKSFRVFLPFMWPSTKLQKAYVVGMLVCSGLQRVTTILQPLVLGMVVNEMTESWSVPWKSLLLFLLIGLVNSEIGVQMVENTFQMYLQGEQELALKRAAYDHILNLSADFHDSKASSYVWTAMLQATSTVRLILDLLFYLIPSIMDLVAGFVVLYTLFGEYMGLLTLATVVLFLWLTVEALSPRADLYRKQADCWYEEHLQMSDSTQNWYTVSEFNQIAHEKKQFRTLGQAVWNFEIRLWWYNEYSSATRYLLMTVAFAAACCLAAVQIARHEQKVGAFVILTTFLAQLTGPLSQLVSEINRTSEKLVRAEKLLVLLEKKALVVDKETAEPFNFLGGEVEFDNVCFSYDGKRQASDCISFRAPAGSTTAIVGETGGGKSTILKLLFRFYDPQQGRVLIDGQDVRDLQLQSFRKHIGWVPQDAVPFNKTILDNVRYSDLDMDTKLVEQACKDAALHDKIMAFTHQYQEKVGERGIKLSGGERQRLAIARAILKAPDILLLDEATSAVDSITEAQIQASLEKLGKCKTTFVIAHRLSTVRKADQILVIHKGRLVEHGTHHELIAHEDGAYKKLWETQIVSQQGGIDITSSSSAATGGMAATATAVTLNKE